MKVFRTVTDIHYALYIQVLGVIFSSNNCLLVLLQLALYLL